MVMIMSMSTIIFYENMYRIRRKSVYHRKYHIDNVFNSICYENRAELSNDQRDRIHKVFAEINSALPSVNKNRKRMISTKYIIRQFFVLLGLPFDFIKVSKSKKTLEFYNRYWAKISQLKFDKIIRIKGSEFFIIFYPVLINNRTVVYYIIINVLHCN